MSKDLREFYTEDEVREIKREAQEMADFRSDESEYESYIEWKWNQAKEAEDYRLSCLAGQLRGLPGYED